MEIPCYLSHTLHLFRCHSRVTLTKFTPALLTLFMLTTATFAAEIVFIEGEARTIPASQRTPARRDPVEYALLTGKPLEGTEWKTVKSDANGNFSGPFTSSGYAQFKVTLDNPKIMFLEASGNSMAYVNGEPHGGDIYLFGYVSIPVSLKKGENHFLFALGRGQFRARLVDIPKPVSLDLRDSTLPDVIIGEKKDGLAAVVVRNATETMLDGLSIQSGKFKTKIERLLPLTTRKVGFQIPLNTDGKVSIKLLQNGKPIDKANFTLRIKQPNQTHKITFRSKIDGSVQYYAVVPSTSPGSGQAMFLSLHGASVEGIGQAEAYSPKSWGTIVCPTNRRPYGFNWEDQGRLDALEVFELAKQKYKPDPRQLYLTGHSMGGHGTWQLGAHYPDQFAAISPAAGWISYWSYAGGAKYPDPSETEKILLRGMSPSDTLGLIRNYNHLGVFIHHGDADDNVPVTEAKDMASELSKFHKDFQLNLVPGAGHWWDGDPEAGADAVDDMKIFDFFAKHRLPLAGEIKNLEFATSDPGVSSRCHWISIDRQDQVRSVSRVTLKAQTYLRTISGTTENVAELTLRTSALNPGGEVTITLDGKSLKVPFAPEYRLTKDKGIWLITTSLTPTFKHGFKSMFDRNFAWIIDDNSPSSMQTARHLAELWRIIANGESDIFYKSEVTDQLRSQRNLIYVTQDKSMLPAGYGDLPVVMTTLYKGQQIGVIYGGAATLRLPFFTAGAHFPDFFEFNPEMLSEGTKQITRVGFWEGI